MQTFPCPFCGPRSETEFHFATEAGRARAGKALLDEKRWEILRAMPDQEAAAALYDGMRPIDTVVTRDQLAEIDTHLTAPQEVRA